MAKKAGDPLAFRIAHLTAAENAGSPPNSVGGANRLKNALLVAAGRAGYGVKPLGENEGMGIACVSHRKEAHQHGQLVLLKLKLTQVQETLQ